MKFANRYSGTMQSIRVHCVCAMDSMSYPVLTNALHVTTISPDTQFASSNEVLSSSKAPSKTPKSSSSTLSNNSMPAFLPS